MARLLLLLCGAFCFTVQASVTLHSRLPLSSVRRWRGGADGDEEEPGLQLPDLSSLYGAGGLDGLKEAMENPGELAETMKMLQDPETMKQVRAMMSNPAFQESMKKMVEQMQADPQFEEAIEKAKEAMADPEMQEKMKAAMEKFQLQMDGLADAEEEEDEEEE